LVRYAAGSKLAGVIYMHRISDKRFTGISGRNFKTFRELCGDTTLKNVIIVTNMWGEVSQDVGESREKELSSNFFKPALEKGAQMARYQNSEQSAHDIIRSIMKNQPMTLQIQRELVDEGKNVIDTAAGEAVNKGLNEQIRRHQAELKAIQEGVMQVPKDKDKETRKELEEENRKLKEEVVKMMNDSSGMAARYQEEKRRIETAMRQMQEQARQEWEKAEVAYRIQMDNLNNCLRERTNASAADREAMQHQWDNRDLFEPLAKVHGSAVTAASPNLHTIISFDASWRTNLLGPRGNLPAGPPARNSSGSDVTRPS
jgi:hypothetical protein